MHLSARSDTDFNRQTRDGGNIKGNEPGSGSKISASKAALAALAALSLAGCSLSSAVNSMPEPQIVTSSVVKNVEQEGIEVTDAELIKQTVADAELESLQSNLLAWSNPDTGNKGTIMAIEKFAGSHGQPCKKFRTTVDSFMGISLYNGETCELKKGFWVISWLLREKSE
jgi:surface antigen